MRGIDQLETADIDVMLGRCLFYLCQWSDKCRLDDAGFGSIGDATQRAFVAGMHNDGRRGRDRLGCCNETIVFRAGFDFARFDGCNAHSQLSDQLANAYEAFARDLPARPNNSGTRSSRLPDSPDISALAVSTPQCLQTALVNNSPRHSDIEQTANDAFPETAAADLRLDFGDTRIQTLAM